MKRLLLIGHEASRTGAPVVLLTIVRELRARGIPCDVVLLRGGHLEREFRALAPTTVLWTLHPDWPRPTSNIIAVRGLFHVVRIIHSGVALVIASFRTARTFRRLQKTDIDCIYVHSIGCAPLMKRISSLKKPVVSSMYELAFSLFGSAHPVDLARFFRASHRIIVPCRMLHELLTTCYGVPAEKIVLLPEPVHDTLPQLRDIDPAAVRRELGIAQDAFVVAMAGTIEWRKGIDLFMGLGRVLAARLPSSCFLWIGAGSYAHLFHDSWKQLYAMDPALAERFIFTGERTDVSRLLLAADVFALTSREDPNPLVHIEAAMLQKPVVCFDGAGGVPEWIGDAGIVVPFQDVHAMAKAIEELSHDPRLREKMGQQGRAYMVTHCEPSMMIDQLLDLIDAAIVGSR